MAVTFRIPKLADEEIAKALIRVLIHVKPAIGLKVIAHLPRGGGGIDVTSPQEIPPQLRTIFDLQSQVIATFQVQDQKGREVFNVSREADKITDRATFGDDWENSIEQSQRGSLPQFHGAFLSNARRELKADDVEAAFKGTSDSEWNRYREAQTAVVNSLQQATENLILKASEQNAELDKQRAQRFEKLEADMRERIERERKSALADHERKIAELIAREQELSKKEASFNTLESHYFARQKQGEQLTQIQGWLDKWSLTQGTSRKRWTIAGAYGVALVFTGWLAVSATQHNFEVLKSVDEIIKLAWWQWVGIWAKSFFPLAGFVTFMIYFIRWSGDWARQHSEEEFRNRTRLVDIGRSSWLLEAVRDAQERNKEIPADLLRELSRNLFATNAGPDSDIHPQAMTDVMMQGLSSLRIKSPDGAEVEATRTKAK